MFGETQKVLKFYETLPDVERYRHGFARKTFYKESWLYFVFLILLTYGIIFISIQ